MEIDNNNIKEGLFNRLRESRNDLLRDNMRRVEHMNRNESILRIYWQMSRMQCIQSGSYSRGRKQMMGKRRWAFIFLEESVRKCRNQSISEECAQIKPRSPFSKESHIDYEADTEDDLEEQDAEELGNNEEDPNSRQGDIDEEDDDDDQDNEDDQDSFISRPSLRNHKPTQQDSFSLNPLNPAQSNKSFILTQLQHHSLLNNYFSQYHLYSFNQQPPLQITNKHNIQQYDHQKSSLDHDLQALKFFITILHGSYASKPEIINIFKQRYSF